MKVSVDIPASVLLEAYREIKKKEGTCRFLPSARFSMADWENDFKLSTLVCSNLMGGKASGVGAQYCKRCLTDSEFTTNSEESE